MVKVIWTDSAIQDLEDIGVYISKDSIRYAERTVASLFDTPILLSSHPKAGKMVPEFGLQSIRELIHGSYRIIYRIVNNEQIDVLRVINSSRLIRNVIKF